MPIEIKELHIRINVDESTAKIPVASTGKKEKEEIIASCVEQVMDILEMKKER